MAKSDILTTVAARIAAATSSTPADELATLKVLGTKLGLDTTNLVTQANTASNTASSKDLYDVVLLNQALDDYLGNTRITTSFPFDVDKGDVIFANEYGSVFKNDAHDIKCTVSPSNHVTTVFNGTFREYYGSIDYLDKTLSVTNGTIAPTNDLFTLVATNGDILILRTGNNDFMLHGHVYIPLTNEHLPVQTNISFFSTNTGAIPEQVSNIFVCKNGNDSWNIYYRVYDGVYHSYIQRRTINYNPTTKSIAQGTISYTSIVSSASSANISVICSSHDNLYTLYSYISGGTTYLYFLVNNTTGVSTALTNISTTSLYNKNYIVKSGSNYYVLNVKGSSASKLTRIDNTNIPISAGTLTELSNFTSGNLMYIKENTFIGHYNGGHRIRIFQFSSDMTASSVITVGNNTTSGSGVTFTTFLQRNNIFYLYSGLSLALVVEWDDVTATEKELNGPKLHKYITDPHGRIDPQAAIVGGSSTSASTSQYLILFYCTQSVLLSNKCTELFKINTTTLKNTNTEVVVLGNTIKDSNILEYPKYNDLVKIDGVFKQIKQNIYAALAVTASVASAAVSYTSNAFTINLGTTQCGLLRKKGKYWLQSYNTGALVKIHSLLHGGYYNVIGAGSLNIIIDVNMPIVIVGASSIQYLGDE